MPESFFTSTVKVEWSPASTPFATSPTWVDITSYVQLVSTGTGKTGSFNLFGAGKATITLDNHLGTFDPTAWYRWRQIRVTAIATGPVTNVLYRGFVENILHDQSGRPGFATAVIQCTDLMGLISRFEYNASSVPEEKSGARVDRILTEVGVPSAWKSVATGYVDISALQDGSYNALQHLQDVAESEAGGFYTTAAGVLTFEDRYENLARLAASPVTVFSDTYSGAEVAFLYGDVVLTPPGRDYRNRINITGASRTTQVVSDLPSAFPPDSLSRTLPMASDGQAEALANLLLQVYKQSTVVWPENLTISVFSQNILDEISALDLRQYCQVEFTPAGKTQQTYKVFVDSVNHSISDVHWTCRVGFSSADRWYNAWGTKNDYLIIGDATYGLIGTGKIGPS